MSDASDGRRLHRLEQTLDTLFAANVAKEVLQAVDFEAILADEPATEPVDVDHLARAIGRPVGRILVSELSNRNGPVGLAAQTIGSSVGSRIAVETFHYTVETVDAEAVTEALVELDEERLPGPALRETLGPAIEDSDVFASDLGEPVDDAGRDAEGCNDAGGSDHTGPLDDTGF